jgi:hypothetical protein
MINAVAAIRHYILSFPEIATLLLDNTEAGYYRIAEAPDGLLPEDILNQDVILHTVTLQQIRVTNPNPYVPIENYRIRIRCYGPTDSAPGQLMNLIINKCLKTEEGWPINNKVINALPPYNNQWFLLRYDDVGDGPLSTVEDRVKFPVVVYGGDFYFDGQRE